MKQFILVACVVLVGTDSAGAQVPQMPAPGKEHAWLQQFVGEWEGDATITTGPGNPSLKAKGVERCRMLGGFWMLNEGKSEVMGLTIQTLLTLGYDPDKKKYVGSWVDSMTTYQWKYEGEVDAAGKVLTLMTEGPSMLDPTKTAKYKEVHEFKTIDHRIFTSSMQGSDGKWIEVVKMDVKRKK